MRAPVTGCQGRLPSSFFRIGQRDCSKGNRGVGGLLAVRTRHPAPTPSRRFVAFDALIPTISIASSRTSLRDVVSASACETTAGRYLLFRVAFPVHFHHPHKVLEVVRVLQ